MDMKATAATANTLTLDNAALDDLAHIHGFVEELDAARAEADEPDDYFQLLPHLSGRAALVALEAVQDDITRPMGIITVMIARKWMLPCIPDDHPLRPVAVALVDSYEDWVVDGESYVEYAMAAWAFNYEHDTARNFGYLCEALPSHGVDKEINNGPRPAVRWGNFGKYLMQRDPAGRQIDELWDALIDAAPDEDGREDDDEMEWWMEVCAAQLNARMDELMKPYDEPLRLTIFSVLKSTLEQ